MVDRILEHVLAKAEQDSDDLFYPANIAAMYALQGNKEQAYAWLQRAIDVGWINWSMATIDPLFENLHDEERFKQMMAGVKARVDEMRARAETQ
jgi:hypothetical protein